LKFALISATVMVRLRSFMKPSETSLNELEPRGVQLASTTWISCFAVLPTLHQRILPTREAHERLGATYEVWLSKEAMVAGNASALAVFAR
jgi:hypothetical protein